MTEPVTARMREGHLEQILDNLLANAIEAVPRGGHITLTALPAGSRIRITVADDGPGMSDRQRQSAFRRYVSATPGGTGLGLAIVHRLATADGGTAELSSTPGGGLTVIVDMPAMSRDRAAGGWALRRPAIVIFSNSEGLLNRIPSLVHAGCVYFAHRRPDTDAMAAPQCSHPA